MRIGNGREASPHTRQTRIVGSEASGQKQEWVPKEHREWGMANRRVQKPRRHRRLSAGDRKVGSMWLVRGAAKLRWSRRSVVWQVWHGASGAGGAKDHQ